MEFTVRPTNRAAYDDFTLRVLGDNRIKNVPDRDIQHGRYFAFRSEVDADSNSKGARLIVQNAKRIEDRASRYDNVMIR